MNVGFNASVYMRAQEIGTKNTQPCSVKSPQSGRKNDSVSISPEAAAFKKLDSGVKEITAQIHGGVSEDRINELKAQIRRGEYNISADAVADAILERIFL